MPEILDSLASPELLDALEANMVAYWMTYARAPSTTATADDEIAWMLTGVPEALFNDVFRARMQPARAPVRLAELYAIQDRLRVPLLWWVGPTAQPANLGDLLAADGWAHAGSTPGMAADLADIRGDVPLPHGVTVKRIHTPEDVQTWAHVAGSGTGFAPDLVETFAAAERYASAEPSSPERRNYIAYLDGKPVATSAVVLSDGVAGLYAVATLPEARRRGIGAAVSRLPLLEARNEGYRVGTLQASEMGRPVYEGLGFRMVCLFEMYVRQAAD